MTREPDALSPREDGAANHLPGSSVKDIENEGFGRATPWQAN